LLSFRHIFFRHADIPAAFSRQMRRAATLAAVPAFALRSRAFAAARHARETR